MIQDTRGEGVLWCLTNYFPLDLSFTAWYSIIFYHNRALLVDFNLSATYESERWKRHQIVTTFQTYKYHLIRVPNLAYLATSAAIEYQYLFHQSEIRNQISEFSGEADKSQVRHFPMASFCCPSAFHYESNLTNHTLVTVNLFSHLGISIVAVAR